MAPAIPVLMVMSTVLATVQTINAGRQAKKTAEYNATIATQNADLARKRGAAQAERKRKEIQKLMGAQRAMLGASGVGSESFRDVLDEQIEMGETDAMNLEFGAQVDAQGFENTAALDRAQGKNAQRSALYQGAATALSGAGSAYSYSKGK